VLAILVAGFVVIPLSVPPGSVALEGANSSIPAVLPPGAAVAANLTVTLDNQDPVPHGYVFTASLTNVSFPGPNGSTVWRNSSALASWEANSTWAFYLPGGRTVVLSGASVTLPESDFVTVNATGNHRVGLLIEFSNPAVARTATIYFSANQLCAPSSGGSTSTTFSPQFS